MQSQKGMWRRVDELGRVVIPKEIRVYLNVKSGDIIEFCTNQDNTVFLRKYHRLDDIQDIANICTFACSNIQDGVIAIASSDKIIASTNKYLLNLSTAHNSTTYLANTDENINNILADKTLHTFNISANGDNHGVVLLYTSLVNEKTNSAIAQILVNLLSKYLER